MAYPVSVFDTRSMSAYSVCSKSTRGFMIGYMDMLALSSSDGTVEIGKWMPEPGHKRKKNMRNMTHMRLFLYGIQMNLDEMRWIIRHSPTVMEGPLMIPKAVIALEDGEIR